MAYNHCTFVAKESSAYTEERHTRMFLCFITTLNKAWVCNVSSCSHFVWSNKEQIYIKTHMYAIKYNLHIEKLKSVGALHSVLLNSTRHNSKTYFYIPTYQSVIWIYQTRVKYWPRKCFESLILSTCTHYICFCCST